MAALCRRRSEDGTDSHGSPPSLSPAIIVSPLSFSSSLRIAVLLFIAFAFLFRPPTDIPSGTTTTTGTLTTTATPQQRRETPSSSLFPFRFVSFLIIGARAQNTIDWSSLNIPSISMQVNSTVVRVVTTTSAAFGDSSSSGSAAQWVEHAKSEHLVSTVAFNSQQCFVVVGNDLNLPGGGGANATVCNVVQNGISFYPSSAVMVERSGSLVVAPIAAQWTAEAAGATSATAAGFGTFVLADPTAAPGESLPQFYDPSLTTEPRFGGAVSAVWLPPSTTPKAPYPAVDDKFVFLFGGNATHVEELTHNTGQRMSWRRNTAGSVSLGAPLCAPTTAVIHAQKQAPLLFVTGGFDCHSFQITPTVPFTIYIDRVSRSPSSSSSTRSHSNRSSSSTTTTTTSGSTDSAAAAAPSPPPTPSVSQLLFTNASDLVDFISANFVPNSAANYFQTQLTALESYLFLTTATTPPMVMIWQLGGGRSSSGNDDTFGFLSTFGYVPMSPAISSPGTTQGWSWVLFPTGPSGFTLVAGSPNQIPGSQAAFQSTPTPILPGVVETVSPLVVYPGASITVTAKGYPANASFKWSSNMECTDTVLSLRHYAETMHFRMPQYPLRTSYDDEKEGGGGGGGTLLSKLFLCMTFGYCSVASPIGCTPLENPNDPQVLSCLQEHGGCLTRIFGGPNPFFCCRRQSIRPEGEEDGGIMWTLASPQVLTVATVTPTLTATLTPAPTPTHTSTLTQAATSTASFTATENRNSTTLSLSSEATMSSSHNLSSATLSSQETESMSDSLSVESLTNERSESASLGPTTTALPVTASLTPSVTGDSTESLSSRNESNSVSFGLNSTTLTATIALNQTQHGGGRHGEWTWTLLVGIVAGAVGALLLLGVLLYCACRRRKENAKKRSPDMMESGQLLNSAINQEGGPLPPPRSARGVGGDGDESDVGSEGGGGAAASTSPPPRPGTATGGTITALRPPLAAAAATSSQNHAATVSARSPLLTAGPPSAAVPNTSLTSGALSLASGDLTFLRRTATKYKIVKLLGKGGYGMVFLVTRVSDGTSAAMKYITCRTEHDMQLAVKEFEVVSKVEHPNVVAIWDIFMNWEEQVDAAALGGGAGGVAGQRKGGGGGGASPQGGFVNANQRAFRPGDDAAIALTRPRYVAMVTPYYAEGDVKKLCMGFKARSRRIPEPQIVSLMAQVSAAVVALHDAEYQVVHRDIKPENILLAENGMQAILTDFGLAFNNVNDATHMTTQAGSLPFVAPECWDRRYTYKVDIWGLGCLLYALCTCRVTADDCRVMFNDVDELWFADELRLEVVQEGGYSEELYKLLMEMLQKRAIRRPDAFACELRLRKLLAPYALDAAGKFYVPTREPRPAIAIARQTKEDNLRIQEEQRIAEAAAERKRLREVRKKEKNQQQQQSSAAPGGGGPLPPPPPPPPRR